MTQSVVAVHDPWLYTFILQPHLEGIERMKRVWSGKEPDDFEPRSLSLKERLVYLISGLLLMLPLIGTIVWMFMQTFGHPERFTEPYHIAYSTAISVIA